ncbi:helix-turn-helix transcriptional regulator [Conexibacter sp. JD483]|uniref:helix-turn-helix transcriptional regulator n=1 Tax=unclassified Conexibacter TaxID=2627773 RepID=UPI00271BFE36|nr:MULTISPECIES: helix-turn-helix transcriptional regulator [unclassified Conexibacter]MDO8187203.1 helix-turn-helix transcriptional regulator [Conexibacter sp. CPCC 205706]MDO8199300.1 helix-turn-helix transcriptional regulator [Conexibacter sp. CPCC 205762]MDR9369299.1 helix-turn-helix transcriptional regulator [Conexibacter sp. JD483]
MLLRDARQRACLSREDLARRSGVSSRQIYDIEHARCSPRNATRAVLAVAVGVPRDQIDWPAPAARAA